MADTFQSTKRREAFEFARAAIRAYEGKQSPENSWQVESAIRLLRKSNEVGPKQYLLHKKDAA